MAPYNLLKHLDAPPRFLSFTMNEVLLHMTPLLIGALLDSILIIPVLGTAVVIGIKKLAKRLPKFYIIRYLYWTLPTKSLNKMLRINLPPSHQRIWIK